MISACTPRFLRDKRAKREGQAFLPVMVDRFFSADRSVRATVKQEAAAMNKAGGGFCPLSPVLRL